MADEELKALIDFAIRNLDEALTQGGHAANCMWHTADVCNCWKTTVRFVIRALMAGGKK